MKKRLILFVLCIVLILSFSSCGNKESSEMVTETDEVSENITAPLRKFHAVLKPFFDEELLIPTWLPDGFEESSIDIYNSRFLVNASALYKDTDGKEITISVCSTLAGSSPKIEVDEDSVEEYERGGKTYHFATNMGMPKAFWSAGKYYVEIFGDATKEEICKMADSAF